MQITVAEENVNCWGERAVVERLCDVPQAEDCPPSPAKWPSESQGTRRQLTVSDEQCRHASHPPLRLTDARP